MRTTLFTLLVLISVIADAAVPQLSDFNTNQFDTSVGIVTIKNGALVTNLVGAGSGSVDWTNAAWGLQPVATNNFVDIHHGTNEIWVNQLATGGNGTTNNPWTGIESATLNRDYTTYHWPQGYYKITNTIDLLGQNTHHIGEAGTVVKFYGTGTALRAQNVSSWTQGFTLENFRIDCQNAVTPTQTPTSLTLSGTLPTIATCTLTNHGYSTGDIIAISGANQLDYNGVRIITVVDTNTFTYLVATQTTNAATATGTFVAKKASVALQLVGVRNQHVKNLAVANCTLGIVLQACVTGEWDNIRCTKFEEPGGAAGAWTVIPVTALLVGTRTNDYSTCQSFRNFIAEGLSDYGLVLFDAANFDFNVGTSEVNERGVLVGAGNAITSKDILFQNWDNEKNTTGDDWTIFAQGCVLQSCFIATRLTLSGGRANRMSGGKVWQVVIRSQVNDALFESVNLTTLGDVADAGNRTRFLGCWFTGSANPPDRNGAWMLIPKDMSTTFAGGTLTLDASLASYFIAKVDGNITLADPLNPTDGQRIRVRFRHSNVSSAYGITNFGSAWTLPSWVVQPDFSTADGYTYMEAQYNGVVSKWQIDRWVDINGSAVPQRLGDGTAVSPAYSFSSSTNYGMYRATTNLMFATDGTDVLGLTSGGATFTNGIAAGKSVVINGPSGGSTNQLEINTGGTNRVSVSNLGALLVSDGSKERPSLGWINDNDGSGTGFYRSTANVINGSINGVATFYMDGSSFRLNADSGSFLLGLANDLVLRRDAAATLQLGSDAAAPISQIVKAHDGTGTDIGGANLILKGGYGTGTGAGGDLITMTSVSSNASGSVVQIYSTRHYESAKPSPMTNSAANPVFNILIGSSHYFGCKIFATTFAADGGGDFQAFTEELIISAVNKGGTMSNTVSTSWGTTLASSVASTLTTTWTAVTSGASLDIKCTPVSSLTPTTYYTKWKVDVLSNDPATITPYR